MEQQQPNDGQTPVLVVRLKAEATGANVPIMNYGVKAEVDDTLQQNPAAAGSVLSAADHSPIEPQQQVESTKSTVKVEQQQQKRWRTLHCALSSTLSSPSQLSLRFLCPGHELLEPALAP